MNENRSFLCKTITPARHFPYLRQEQVLSLEEQEEIQSQVTLRAKVNKLLDVLVRTGGPKAYHKFMESMVKDGTQGHVIEKLNKALQEKMGRPNVHEGEFKGHWIWSTYYMHLCHMMQTTQTFELFDKEPLFFPCFLKIIFDKTLCPNTIRCLTWLSSGANRAYIEMIPKTHTHTHANAAPPPHTHKLHIPGNCDKVLFQTKTAKKIFLNAYITLIMFEPMERKKVVKI